MFGDYGTNFRAPRVDVHQFSMIPRAEIPRSAFRMQTQHKTTIDASYLYPVFLQEVLPGDTFNVSMTAFCRLSTPLFPILDNMDLESFFFFVPCRLLWIHWYKFMGEQDNPTDSTSFSIPQCVSPANGFAQLSLFDYFGLPTAGQIPLGNTISVSALPFRAYNLIWNQWFRDENLLTSQGVGSTSGFGYASMDDGPDPYTNYKLMQVCKRHDYFTSCLPWTQKGGTPISVPLAGSAPVFTGVVTGAPTGAQSPMTFKYVTAGGTPTALKVWGSGSTGGQLMEGTGALVAGADYVYPNNLYANLSLATGATINALRLSFQTQKLLERDARGGTRYTEIIRSHFGVVSPDMRLMRPEYLGGGKSAITIAPVPQTTATGLTGGTSPMGTLAAVGTAVMRPHGFRYSATEHGYIVGLVTARRDPVYQQGVRRLWSRLTRYDFFWPVFSMLGEQAVNNIEIYAIGNVAQDTTVFGYQERWAEYRYMPSMTSGYFRSTNATPLDAWHLAQNFSSLPLLNNVFVVDETTTVLNRVLAAGAASQSQQLLCDFFFDQRVARPMPLYSVPGMIDRF